MSGVHQAADARPEGAEKPVGQLVREIATDLTTLLRQELELAKVEMKQEAVKSGKAAGMLGGAGFAGWMLALFLSLAAVWLLDAAIDAGWAALIVAAVWGVVAAVLYSQGRKRLKQVDPKPERTVKTVKEDVEWARNRSS